MTAGGVVVSDDPEDVELYPVTIIATRYGGRFERGGRYAAFKCDSEAVPLAATANDVVAEQWWRTNERAETVGTGSTPDEALIDLAARLRA